jgi:hypothetical protein
MHNTQRMVSTSTFLKRYHKEGDEFLNIIRVTGDETSVAIVNVETKEHSKKSMPRHSLNKPEKFQETLCTRKTTGRQLFQVQERSAYGVIHILITKDHNNDRSVLQNTV